MNKKEFEHIKNFTLLLDSLIEFENALVEYKKVQPTIEYFRSLNPKDLMDHINIMPSEVIAILHNYETIRVRLIRLFSQIIEKTPEIRSILLGALEDTKNNEENNKDSQENTTIVITANHHTITDPKEELLKTIFYK